VPSHGASASQPACPQASQVAGHRLASMPAGAPAWHTDTVFTLPAAAALPAASWLVLCATIPAHPATQWCSVRRMGVLLCARGAAGAGVWSDFPLALAHWHARFCPHLFCRNMLAELPKWL
jgi:hypothetical protein